MIKDFSFTTVPLCERQSPNETILSFEMKFDRLSLNNLVGRNEDNDTIRSD